MKKVISLAVVLCVLVLASSVTAQTDSTRIEYSQTVTGEITNQSFEVPYVFSGKQGDVIVIEMVALDSLDGLKYPAVILFDAEFNMLGTVDSYGSVVLAARLPSDGDYNIVATRRDGRAGESVGEYTLTVLKPSVLVPSESVAGTVTSETKSYYVVEATESFSIIYERAAGDFHPEMSIQRISETNQLQEVGVLGGEMLSQGKIEVDATAGPYCIILKESLGDFNLDEVSADYTLTLAP